MQHGLDAQHAAQQRRGARNAPAAEQKVQIIHSKPADHFLPIVRNPLGQLVQGFALAAPLQRIMHQQPLPQGRPQRIHHLYLRGRIFLHHHLSGNHGRLEGSADAAGQAEAQQAFPTRGMFLKQCDIIRRGNLRCSSHAPFVQPLIKASDAGLFYRSQAVFLIIQTVGHGNDLEFFLLLHIAKR